MLNIDREGLRNLTRALRDQDEDSSFDRCNVSNDNCKRPTIDAHALPRTALKLIARDNKVYSNHPHPPQNPLAFVKQNPLSLRSIASCSVGRWTCKTHDQIFEPIDCNNIDLRNPRNLFLTIHRVTLRMTHLWIRTVSRYVFPIMDPETPMPEGLSEAFVDDSKEFVRRGTFNAIRLFDVQAKMQYFLSKGDYYKLDYGVFSWEAEPTIAAAGISWCDGPSGKSTWSGRATLLPCWFVVLPQVYGQAIVTACPVGFRKYSPEINKVASGMKLREGNIRNDWAEYANHVLMNTAVDLAIAPASFESAEVKQTNALQDFLRQRSVEEAHGLNLPNFLKSR